MHAKIVVEVKFVSTTREDHNVKIVVEVKLVNTTRRSHRKDCSGSQLCEHNKERSTCPTCDPLGHLTGIVRGRVYIALKNDKEISPAEYLECIPETFKKHIE